MKNFTRKNLIKISLMTATLLVQSVVNFTTLCGRVGAVESAAIAAAPNLKFYAMNPGYTVDSVKEVGEMVMLKNMQGGSFSLAGFAIEYINSSGNSSTFLEFPAGSQMIGEDLLLRLASDTEPADLSYSKSLAMKGALRLLYEGEVVDTMCWLGGEGCVSAFSSTKPGMLVRNLETMEFEKVATDYLVPSYNADAPGILLAKEPVEEPKEESAEGSGEKPIEDSTEESKNPTEDEGRGEAVAPHCRGLQFSEILSYYETAATEQFIEFYNASDGQMVLDGCSLKYKNKFYPLTGILGAEKYLSYAPGGFTLTKNPTSQNELVIIDADGSEVDKLIYYNGQKKGVAMAQFGYDETGEELWLATYAPTPGEENNYQKYKTCEEGKVINEETGNCVKATTLDTTLEACPEGKYRNPLTGRCKSYETTSEPAACAEGYERNPDTGRCRKIKTNTGADYALASDEEVAVTVNFVALAGIIAVAVLGLVYVIWQFRKEIGLLAKKVGHSIRSWWTRVTKRSNGRKDNHGENPGRRSDEAPDEPHMKG